MEFVKFFQTGGPFMYPILIVFAIGLAIAFERFLYLSRTDSRTKKVWGELVPMLKARPNMGLLDFIYTSLDVSAQKATATPEIQQGALSDKDRTLGELNLISSNVDTRYSLSAKVFGWSEG